MLKSVKVSLLTKIKLFTGQNCSFLVIIFKYSLTNLLISRTKMDNQMQPEIAMTE